MVAMIVMNRWLLWNCLGTLMFSIGDHLLPTVDIWLLQRNNSSLCYFLFLPPSLVEVPQGSSDVTPDIISYYHPNITVNLVDDHTQWVKGSVPQPLDKCKGEEGEGRGGRGEGREGRGGRGEEGRGEAGGGKKGRIEEGGRVGGMRKEGSKVKKMV